MMNTLFLQSDTANPYALYAGMRANHPVHFDEENRIWAIYTHAHCKRVLEESGAHIPGQNAAAQSLMSTSSSTLLAHFARLANPPQHAARREAVMRLLGCMKPVDTAMLLENLIGSATEFDWVGAVCRKLPALAVMKAFGFADCDIDIVLPQLERLTKIMLANKSPAQIEDINIVAEEVLFVTDRHLSRTFPSLAEAEEARHLHASNLVGLMVQSVDAGRGILSNALLQALQWQQRPAGEGWQKLVTETLRFDPPIQNTRRVLNQDMELGGCVLPKGAAVLVVLASANRDEGVFENADCFDISRSNNDAHLTFGAGIHHCAAHRFATAMAAEALAALFREGRGIESLQPQIDYEPMVNARLPKEIRLRYSS
jgi:cytochrome P450